MFNNSLSRLRRKASYFKRRLRWFRVIAKAEKSDIVKFRCNICGNRTSFPASELTRENSSCVYCGSTIRWRSVIHVLSVALFGKSIALPDFPNRPDICGFGMSDWEGYAASLAKKLSYTNTFYHQEPRLDITKVEIPQPTYDFIISTEVYEHICPPVSRAFENARRLLKPGGVMVFTVPYVLGKTVEHFPGTCTFSLQPSGSDWVLSSNLADGTVREYRNLIFHGGAGVTVEMRLYGKDDLFEECRNAGFKTIRIHDEAVNEFCIKWIPTQSKDRPHVTGLENPPWALFNG
jgi:SAM-dependent methyltransferase